MNYWIFMRERPARLQSIRDWITNQINSSWHWDYDIYLACGTNLYNTNYSYHSSLVFDIEGVLNQLVKEGFLDRQYDYKVDRMYYRKA